MSDPPADPAPPEEKFPQAARENPEPRADGAPIPFAFLAVSFALLIWGGVYLAMHDGGFRADVFDAGGPASRLGAEGSSGGGTADPAVAGKRIFTMYCAVCHQLNGQGIENQYPPLAGSEWVLAREWHGDNHLVKVVLNGLQGPISVKGKPFNSVMAPWGGVLRDEQIAAILTFIRKEWGNDAPPISAEFVAAVRKGNGERRAAWTEKELRVIERLISAPPEEPPPPAGSKSPGPGM